MAGGRHQLVRGEVGGRQVPPGAQDAGAKSRHEPLAQGGNDILLGGEVEIEGAFGDFGPGGDLVDRRGADALGNEQRRGGPQDIVTAHLGWLGAWFQCLPGNDRHRVRLTVRVFPQHWLIDFH